VVCGSSFGRGGGSYPEAESGLSKITLEWMLVEATAAGLQVDPYRANVVLGRQPAPEPWMPFYVEPNATAAAHESLRGAWWILELLPHRYVDKSSGVPVVRWRIPMGRRRTISDGSIIHDSVLTHGEADRLPALHEIEPTDPFPQWDENRAGATTA
jgi:hypothetical protein